jgi:xanthosine phosphorylase
MNKALLTISFSVIFGTCTFLCVVLNENLTMSTPFNHTAFTYLKNHSGTITPKVGLILGSGLDSVVEKIEHPISIPYAEIPGFITCSALGHKGVLVLGSLAGLPIACLQGRFHYYEGNDGNATIQTLIRTLKLLGCEIVILTNAAASLRQEVRPGSLVVITDHINFQGQNPLVGPNDDHFGPRFLSLQNAYDENLVELALEAATELDIKLSTGIYLATLGPCYETPAEIQAFKHLGADMVGMSTVPEVIVARHCNLKVLAISVITNMACGMSNEELTHEEVLKVAKMAVEDLSHLLTRFFRKLT